jgi:bifunctional UDP-N-acetylglucosamine pyrophosphorylase/glucosamine-1-phosphate N-acetyltransferase
MINNLHDLSIIILSAGKGTRMKSKMPKVLHKIAGREMIHLVIDEATKLNPRAISVVISEDLVTYQEKILEDHKGENIFFGLQELRQGTADAVKIGLSALPKITKKILVLYADTPLLTAISLEAVLHKIDTSAVCVLGFHCKTSNAYGRLVLDHNKNLIKIVEAKDANKNEENIVLCNSGVMALDGKRLCELLERIKNNNKNNEFYLTDIVEIANLEGLKADFVLAKKDEVLGVNSRYELSLLEKIKQNILRKNMMNAGVTLIDPDSIHFSFDTKISPDTIIHPHVVFGVGVKIESDVEIKSFCHIEGADIASGSKIGPFARIRPDTKIFANSRIGNFVEIKKSTIKKGAKINHLSYIGDSEIGCESNIGAGVITCNYDGYEKHKTKIGKNVFVGSNSSLIAPLKIENNSIIGAGSIITKDVMESELAVSRALQKNIKNGAKKFHNKRK